MQSQHARKKKKKKKNEADAIARNETFDQPLQWCNLS